MPRTPKVCLPEFCSRETIDGFPFVRLTVALLRLSTFNDSLVTKGLAAPLSDGLTDQAGAVIPGANIAVIDVAQGFARHATANEQGIFVVALFPGKVRCRKLAPVHRPGEYECLEFVSSFSY